MSTDLEQLLKTTLGNRADTITSGPQWIGAPAPQRRRPPRWSIALAAAAVVGAVAVGVVALPDHDSRNAPASPTPSPRSTSSAPIPEPTKVVPAPVGKTCATTLPSTWLDAMQHSGVDLGSSDVVAWSATPDGTVVVVRDEGPAPGSPRQVVLVPKHGAASVAYSVSDPDTRSVQGAWLYEHRLVVAETAMPRPAAHTIPGNYPMPNVLQLLSVDLTSGDVVPIAAGHTSVGPDAGTPYIDGATVIDGRVYWDERTKYGAADAKVRSYGITTRDYRTEYDGKAGYLSMRSYGIFDGTRAVAGVHVPKIVREAVHGRLTTLDTDGTAWTWADAVTHEMGWWEPGLARPIIRSVPGYTIDTDDGHAGTGRVVGPYVVTGPIIPSVLDMTTGAIAKLPEHGLYGGHDEGQFDFPSGGGIAVGAAYFGKGHFVDGYWAESSRTLLRLDTTDLPDLSC